VITTRQPEQQRDREGKVQLTQRASFHAACHASEARASGRQKLDRGDEQRAGARQQEDGPDLMEEKWKREREQAGTGVQQLARRFGTCGTCSRLDLQNDEEQQKRSERHPDSQPRALDEGLESAAHCTCSTRSAM